MSGDPLRPGLAGPTPAEVVGRLSRTERVQRVKALVEQAEQITADALAAHADGHTIVGKVLLWSGGNDSNTLAHLMRGEVTHAAHANTGIGIEATRQFVRDTCAAWRLPLIEKHPPPGSTYRELVLGNGFPGPAHHYKMYQRLKERCLRQVRAELVKRPRHERVLFIAGRRRDESARRSGKTGGKPVPLYERVFSTIWCSPLANWTALDLNTYRTLYPDVPRNPVVDHLHMSGECLCGAFAKRDEFEQIRDWYPDTAAEIAALAAEALARGVKPERCQWGWGAYRDGARRSKSGRMCSSCQA